MNNAWENLNKTWKERLEKLEDAMQAAVQYQDTLQVRGQEVTTLEIQGFWSFPEFSTRVNHLHRALTEGNTSSMFLARDSQFWKKHWHKLFLLLFHF